MTETLRQDLRIGLRVLIREKGFCALAVVVLSLGIAAVTTLFSVVNGVMLRGFSFPTADRLVSVNFIDPSSATFFGVNGQISSKDFQELLPQQQSFERLAAYINGATVNVTVNGADGPLTLAPQDPLRLVVSFDPGSSPQLAPAEVYFAVVTSAGIFWWNPVTQSFASTVTRLFTGDLPAFGPLVFLDVPNVSTLPPGTYWWVVIIDNDSNGVPNGTFFDFVQTSR